MHKDANLPLSTLAKLLDLTPRRVQQLTKSGALKTEARARYSPSAVTDYIRYLRERISDPPAPKEFRESHDEQGALMGYERDEPQLYLTIDLAVEFTEKSLESVSRAARGLESFSGPNGARLYRSDYLLERIYT
jgi:phage terminase Nu1 subunit (DNA packaging protein)